MAQLKWEMLDRRFEPEMLGFIPGWLNDEDPRSLVEQMDAGYGYGGFKAHPITGFKAVREKCLKYPGDPLLRPLAQTELHGETLCFYDSAICAVWREDGSFVASRFD